MNWPDWIVAPPGCYEQYQMPGSCVPPGGLEVVGGFLLFVVIIVGFLLYRANIKPKNGFR